MNMNEAFPSKYIKAVDLKGQPMTLTMSNVELESFSNGEQGCVLYFQGAKKGLSLNKTKTTTIMDAYGPDSDQWGGKQVILTPGKATFQGKRFDVVDVDIPQGPAQPAPEPQATTPPPDANPFSDVPDDDIPF